MGLIWINVSEKGIWSQSVTRILHDCPSQINENSIFSDTKLMSDREFNQ